MGRAMRDDLKIPTKYIERNPRKNGSFRYFFRKGGKRFGRIHGEPGTDEFLDNYNAYVNGTTPTSAKLEPSRAKLSRVEVGTFGAACMAYMHKSMAFKRLDQTTKAKRRSIIDSMVNEPLTPDANETRRFRDFPLAKIARSDLEVLRDRKADLPFAADERVKILSQVFKYAKSENIISTDPTMGLQKYHMQTDGHTPASWEHIESFKQHHGTQSNAWLGMLLLIFTGVRVSDLRKLGRQHRQRRSDGDYLCFRMQKGRNKRPVDMEIFIHPALGAALDAIPMDRMTYLVTAHHLPFSSDKAMSARVSSWFKQAGIHGITAHSVRKLLSIELAQEGATNEEMDGALGWTSPGTSKIYTSKANRGRLSKNAVLKLNFKEKLPHPAPADKKCGN